MDDRRRVIAVLVLAAACLVAGAAYYFLAGSSLEPAAPPPGGEERSGGVAGPTPVANGPAAASRPATATEASGGVPALQPPERPMQAIESPTGPAAAPGAGSSGASGQGSGSTASQGDSKASANKEDIRAAIRELVPQVKDCYEQGLKRDPTMEGTVKVEFTLAKAPDGGAYAREGEVNDSSLRAPLVEACILNALQHAHFKELKGEGEVHVRYPFKFGSGAGGFGGE